MITNKIQLNLTDVSVAASIAQVKYPLGLVIFSEGNAGSHGSYCNDFIADVLIRNRITTVLADLLTPEEDAVYENRFNINLLTDRLIRITEKVLEQFAFDNLPIGFFGARNGAACALDAAAFLGDRVKAVITGGGRPDLAKDLRKVQSPTLMIMGSKDIGGIDLNKKAFRQLSCDRKIEMVDGASNLFEEPGTLSEVANLSTAWYDLYLCQTLIENTY